MSQGPRSEFYRYSLKSSAIANTTFCTARIFAYPVPPKNALSLEGIFMHLRMTFDSAVDVGDRVIESVGIAHDRPDVYTDLPDEQNIITINESADVNRVVDIKIDLTSLIIDKTKVDYDSELEADYATGDKTMIVVKVPDALLDEVNVGTIDLWKIDTIWTTREIR